MVETSLYQNVIYSQMAVHDHKWYYLHTTRIEREFLVLQGLVEEVRVHNLVRDSDLELRLGSHGRTESLLGQRVARPTPPGNLGGEGGGGREERGAREGGRRGERGAR